MPDKVVHIVDHQAQQTVTNPGNCFIQYLLFYYCIYEMIKTLFKGVPKSDTKIFPGVGRVVGTVRKQMLSICLLLFGLRQIYAKLLLSKLPNICFHSVPTFSLIFPTITLNHPTFLLKFLNKQIRFVRKLEQKCWLIEGNCWEDETKCQN